MSSVARDVARSVSWLFLLLAAATVACSASSSQLPLEPASRPASERTCTADADCVVTGFGAGCCACTVEPYSVNRQSLAKRTDVCTVVECACATGGCKCPKVAAPASFRAVCAEGQCQRRGP